MEIIVTIALIILVIFVIYLLCTCLKQQEQIENIKKHNQALQDSLATVHKFYEGDLE